MAWLGKVSLGNFPDLAGAVNKLSESVKNIEKNFDSALGIEERSSETGDRSSGEASGSWSSSADGKALFDSVTTFMGQRSGENAGEASEKAGSSGRSSSAKEQEKISTDKVLPSDVEQTTAAEEEKETQKVQEESDRQHVLEKMSNVVTDVNEMEVDSHSVLAKSDDPTVGDVETTDSLSSPPQMGSSEGVSADVSYSMNSNPVTEAVAQAHSIGSLKPDEPRSDSVSDMHEENEVKNSVASPDEGSMVRTETLNDGLVEADIETSTSRSADVLEGKSASELSHDQASIELHPDQSELSHDQASIELHPDQSASVPADSVSNDNNSLINAIEAHVKVNDYENDTDEVRLSSGTSVSDSVDYAVEIEKVKKEMKMMESALQGAAKQAQAKADEIAKFMNENEQLKAIIEDLKRKSNEAEIETLREEYHQRVSTLERRVYTLTKERDTLRREQNRKNDATALLKEKDEIINQVMAEGEELSKKQAVQESTIRKLRAQIREFEEEKKGLITKLQVEENKVESIKRDKTATEKLLQETIEKHQIELVTQKEHYTTALNAAKEAEALAEARANTEARTELESRLREAEERETTLVQALEELRQTLTRTEQQAAFREDMLRRDVDDLQKRYQASERRCEELITQVPESTRPLLRQIEAMQETIARKGEAWAGLERVLSSRLQEAEAKAATAEENERAMNERLSQTLSRVAVLEAQVSCLRAEQTQLTKSLEKERQRASENRQEYLAAQEAVATHEVRVNQLEEVIKDLRRNHKQELQDLLTQKELLQQELEKERTAKLDLQQSASAAVDQSASIRQMRSSTDNGNISMRKLSSAGSLSSIEESFFLQASLDSSESPSERKYISETTMTPYFLKSMTPSAFEAALRQKDGELASYMSRLASLESIRDSLAEELVKMTSQCEKLNAEAAILPSMKAELEALRRRHSAALELMGERDEELEELRADIMDLKEMYREQVNLLVNKIQIMSSSGAT